MIYTKKLTTITLKLKESEAVLQKLSSSDDVYQIAKSVYANLDDDQEHFTVFFLTGQNKVTGFKTIFSGGQTHSDIDMKLIFRNALAFGAIKIVCIHNHPSGTLRPSQEDLEITKAIKKAGDLLQVKLLDHLILTKTGYYSFADSGNLI